MNKLFVIILFFLSQITTAQNNIIVEYKDYRTYTKSIINVNSATLYITSDNAYYKSEVFEKINTGSSIEVNGLAVKNENSETIDEIIIDRKKKTLTQKISADLFLTSKYAVVENLPKMIWKLTSDKKNIGKFECKKATTTFRGREYEAWYTEQIPVSLGPWKFNGLPGLILEAKDKSETFKWELKSVKNATFSIDSQININKRYEILSFENFDKKRVNKINDKINIIRTRNASRDFKVGFMYTTDEEREPINEFRNQTTFR